MEAAVLDGLPKEPPEILTFSPQTAAEKTMVTISGNNFFKVSAVKFGGVNADSYNVISSSEIRAVVGSGASGALKVVAQSGIGSKMGFVYNPAKLVTISNTPESALITSPAQILSISVQGNYSDGSTSIVTASSEFYSTDPEVVSVDANGVVTVKGEGVADIVSTISNLTAITQVSVDISSIIDREWEPKNSIANANPVDISSNVYRGNLSNSSDVDYYKITISSPSVLTVLIRPSNDSYTGGVVRASIIDVSGTIYAAKQISSDMSSYVNLSAALIDSGNYYLRIDKLNYYSVFTKDYEFLVQSNDDPILFGKREKEPNDSMIQATVFPIDDGSVYGQLSSTTDIDMYAYDLAKGVFLLQVKPENNVYDGGVIVVSIKDSSGVVLSSKEVLSTQSTFIALTARIDTAGRYYVVVNRKPNYSIFTKDYALLVDYDPALLGDINNDGKVDISDVILYLRISLCLDWCGVPPPPCSDINADGKVDISDVILTLRIALGLDEVTSTQSTFIALTAHIDTAGRYYVVVNSKPHYSIFTKDYELLVNYDPALLGDINNDGKVDISDVILVLKISLGQDPIRACPDIDASCLVDISDVILTLRMALGLDPLKPCTE